MLCIGVLIVEAFFLHFLTTIGIIVPDTILASILIILFSCSFAVYVATTKKYKDVCIYMICGLCFRIALLYWDLYFRDIYVLPSSASDSEGHWASAVSYARGNNIGRSARKPFGIAVRYLGEQRLLIQFIMVLSAIITIFVVFKILEELQIPDKIKNICIFLLAMLPNYAILSSIFMMEAFPAMFSAIALFFFVRWYKGEGERNFWYTFIAALLAAFFHTGIITALAGYVLIRLIYAPKKQELGGGSFHFSYASLALGLFFIAVFVVLFMYVPVFSDKIPRITDISQIDSGVNWDNIAKSGYARYVGRSDSISSIIIYTPLRIIFFLFSPMPLPFQMRGLQDIIAMVFGSFFYMYTYYRAIRYIHNKNNKYRNLAICILIVGLITAFVFGWGRADVGTNSRHREKLVAVYVVLLAISMTDDKHKTHKHRQKILQEGAIS